MDGCVDWHERIIHNGARLLGHDDGHDILALFFLSSDLFVYTLVYKDSETDSNYEIAISRRVLGHGLVPHGRSADGDFIRRTHMLTQTLYVLS